MPHAGDSLSWRKLGDAQNIHFKWSLIITLIMAVTSLRETMEWAGTLQHGKEVPVGAITKVHNCE